MMKKSIFIFFFILVTNLITLSGKASPPGIPLKDYQSVSFDNRVQLFQHNQLLKNMIILPEGEFSEKDALEMIGRIDRIDTKVLEQLSQQGVQLKLFTGRLTDQPSAAHLKGKKPRGYSEDGPTWDFVPGIGGSKTVLAKIGSSKKGNGHGSVNLELHELAHSVDKFVFDSISENPDFLNTFNTEANNMFPDQSYFITYPEEYFAEVFAFYYLSDDSRNLLKRNAPLTYQLLNGLTDIHRENR